MTYSVFPMTTPAAAERASGSDGAAFQMSRLPDPTARLKYTSAVAAVPSLPPA